MSFNVKWSKEFSTVPTHTVIRDQIQNNRRRKVTLPENHYLTFLPFSGKLEKKNLMLFFGGFVTSKRKLTMPKEKVKIKN